MQKRKFDEVRIRPGKDSQQFTCVLLQHEGRYLVLGYASGRAWEVGAGIRLPAGTRTIAHYWEGAGYVVWEMRLPDGAVAGYLIHLVRDVRIGHDRVEYRDLFLDLWFDPDLRYRILDADELAAAFHRGLLSEEEVRYVEANRDFILRRFPSMLRNLWKGEFDPEAAGGGR